MPKRTEGIPSRTGRAKSKEDVASLSVVGSEAIDLSSSDRKSRVDQLVGLVDNCTAAKEAADEIGEKFLSYLLAMTIQEGRAALRRTGPGRRLTN